MSEFIEDLIDDILLCLPVKTLLRFRCLSKSFRTKIDSSAFATAHLDRSRQTQTRRKLVFCRSIKINGVDLDDEIDGVIKLCNPLKPDYCFNEILGSCNGLLLLHNDYDTIVWNPFTRRYERIPSPDYQNHQGSSFGFSYDSASNEYKVVTIQNQISSAFPFKVRVFHLASNTWSEVLQLPFQNRKYFPIRNPGVFANGGLHWLCTAGHTGLVFTFDFSKKELLKVFPSVQSGYSSGFLSLQVLDGRLFLGETSFDGIELSDTVDYGQGFAWRKLYKMNSMMNGDEFFYPLDYMKVLEYSKAGNKILLQYPVGLFWYDFQQRIYESARIPESETPISHYETNFCWDSLVSVGADNGFDGA